MAALRIIAPGAHSTVQDLGRYGYQAQGVPVSGALDSDSLRLANALAGNGESGAAIEILYHGPDCEILADSVRIAVGGAGASLDILADPPQRLDAWRSHTLQRGQKFRVNPGDGIACCYLAVAGGFDLPECLGSLSTYTRAGFGGFQGRALRPGDELPLNRNDAPDGEDSALRTPPEFAAAETIRIVWGLQREYFTPDSLDAFVSAPFRILTEADRMGYRIEGPELAHCDGYDIVSDGIATGSIQVPGSGQPIILLADHQTTGGYPKIATVISADLPALGRRKPGDEIRFQAVNVAEAERLRRAHETEIERLIEGMVAAPPARSLDLKALYESNLISGVIVDPDRQT